MANHDLAHTTDGKSVATDRGYTFTAADGKRYRTTGEFRCARDGELLVHADGWRYGGMNTPEVQPCIGDATTPSIIVTPVEPRYEVTVVLSEERVNFHRRAICAAITHNSEETAIHDAIKQGNYRQLDD